MPPPRPSIGRRPSTRPTWRPASGSAPPAWPGCCGARPTSGPSPSQLTALATIAGEGPLTLGALADIEHVAPPTITKVVEKLEAQGLIERRADVDDRRRSLATATPAGLALLAEGRARKDAILATRIAQLDPDQLDRLADALDVLEVLAGR